MNHVINLIIEIFLKSIKIVDINKKDNHEDENKDDNNDKNDENDLIDEDENDDDMDMNVEDTSILSIEFKFMIEKIHKIIKLYIIDKRILILDYQYKLFNN